MTDNKSDEERIREILNARGVQYDEHEVNGRHVFLLNYCDLCDDYLAQIEIIGACIMATKSYLMPEQAVASALGFDRDAIYDEGFDRGRMATLQQLEGMINERLGMVEIVAWLDEQLEEFES